MNKIIKNSNIQNKFLLSGLFIFIIGMFILFIPDNAPAVIIFNQQHAPSWIDMPGIALMFTGWLMLGLNIITQWKKIQLTLGKTRKNFLILIYLVSISGIIISLGYSIEWLLWLCAGLAFLVNAFFIYQAFVKN